MTRTLAMLSAAAAAAFLMLTPASAQWRGNDYYDDTYNANGYQTQRSFNEARYGRGWNRQWSGYGGNYGGGWNSRSVSGADPSFGNRAGINAARRTGRCVTDLGYGRYEYCGW